MKTRKTKNEFIVNINDIFKNVGVTWQLMKISVLKFLDMFLEKPRKEFIIEISKDDLEKVFSYSESVSLLSGILNEILD